MQDQNRSDYEIEIDRVESTEWHESLDYVLQKSGPGRVRQLIATLQAHARGKGVRLPFAENTPYINTIPLEQQPPYPGSHELEHRIRNIIRWNAMAMVVRANMADKSLGGHIATYASIADLFEVGTLVKILRIVDSRQEGKQALVVGIERARIEEFVTEFATLRGSFSPLQATAEEDGIEETWHRVVELTKRVIDLREDYPDDWKAFIEGIPRPGMLADLLASNLTLPSEDGISLLREPREHVRLKIIEQHLEREVTIAQTQKTLRDQAESSGICLLYTSPSPRD